MRFYVYVVTKESNSYKIREVPITESIDLEISNAMASPVYISHFVTTIKPSLIIDSLAPDFQGVTFL